MNENSLAKEIYDFLPTKMQIHLVRYLQLYLHVSYLDEDEEDMLLPLVEKRLKGDFEKKNIDKCIRYFMYRGYGFSDIKNCIDNIKEEYGE